MSFAIKDNDIPADASHLIGRVATGYSGSYKIIELIGRGGMSDVFKASIENIQSEDPISTIKTTNVGRIVACKILLARLLENKLHYKRFQHEATLAKRLAHPNIVNVYDAGEIDNRPFMILEYVEGNSLADLCKSEGKVPIQRALPIFLQISGAFAYAHLNNVIHRDLKPSNVMLTKKNERDDFVKIVDFGIAKIAGETVMGSTQLTKTGEVLGTPLYMSPEQCRGEDLDLRSDIYSLGILMYEVLAGYRPFEGTDSWSTLIKQTTEAPKELGSIDPDILLVKKLERIIFKCLEKEPSARYQSMDELKRELELIQSYFQRISSGRASTILLRIVDSILQTPTLSIKLLRKAVHQRFLFPVISIVLIIIGIEYLSFHIGPGAKDRNLPIRACVFPRSAMASVLNYFWDSIKIYDTPLNNTDRGEELIDPLLSKAEVSRLSGDFSDAVDKYSDAFVLSDKHDLHLKNSPMGAEAESHLAYCFLLGSDDIKSSRQAATSSLSTFKTCGLEESPRALLAYAIVAESSWLLGDLKNAEACFDKFYQISFEHSIERISPFELAIGNSYAASFYGEHKNVHSAEILYHRAIADWQRLGEPALYNLGATCNARALLEFKEHDLNAAEQDLNNARMFLARANASTKDLAVISFSLADISFAKRDFIDWFNRRKQALELWSSR